MNSKTTTIFLVTNCPFINIYYRRWTLIRRNCNAKKIPSPSLAIFRRHQSRCTHPHQSPTRITTSSRTYEIVHETMRPTHHRRQQIHFGRVVDGPCYPIKIDFYRCRYRRRWHDAKICLCCVERLSVCMWFFFPFDRIRVTVWWVNVNHKLISFCLADRSHGHLHQIFRRMSTNTMQRLWPNQRHVVSMDRTMNKKMIHSIVAAAIIRWSLAMYLTIDIAWYANLAGAIFQPFGSVGIYRTQMTLLIFYFLCQVGSSWFDFSFMFYSHRMQDGKLRGIESDQKCSTLHGNGRRWDSFARGDTNERNETSVLWENCETFESFHHSRREWCAHMFGIRSARLQPLQVNCEK